jgi:hypothetical protein
MRVVDNGVEMRYNGAAWYAAAYHAAAQCAAVSRILTDHPGTLHVKT